MKNYPLIALRQIKQSTTLDQIENLRARINTSINLTEEEKKQAHFHCDGRENVINF